MKLKYYMRGLGIGILVTSVIVGLTGGSEELTDAQIKARAASLGMVEQSSPSQLASEGLTERETAQEEDLTEEAATAEEAEGAQEAEESSKSPGDSQEAQAAQEEAASEESAGSGESPGDGQEETKVQEEDPEATTVSSSAGDSRGESDAREEPAARTGSIEVEGAENYVVINIERGNGSDIVAHKLYEAGLIPSAKEYDRYLVENGYDRRLEAGYHEIPTGSTWEEMAQILCAQ